MIVYKTMRYAGLRFNESETLEMYTTTMEFIYSMKSGLLVNVYNNNEIQLFRQIANCNE